MTNNYKKNVEFKSDFLKVARDALVKDNFCEIQTPKISFMPTDQKDHLFELNYFGREAYLIQSPQFYKQAYIANGFDAVFEIAPVFRAEERVTKRHLSEFSSFDIESSRFKKLDDIISFESNLIREISAKLSKKYQISPITTFETVSYGEVKKLLKLKSGEKIGNAHEDKISKLFSSDGVFIVDYPSNERVFYYEDKNGSSFSYDLIVRGLEITSGGIRTISKQKLIQKMEADGIDITEYSPYLDLFDLEVPAHGGFGIGIERIISRYLEIEDVLEINPFSKKPNTIKENLVFQSQK